MKKEFEGHSRFMGAAMAECDCKTPHECMEAEECLSELFNEYEWLEAGRDEWVPEGWWASLAAVIFVGIVVGSVLGFLAVAWRAVG